MEVLLVEDEGDVVDRMRDAFETADIETTLRTASTEDRALAILSDRRKAEGQSIGLVLVDRDLGDGDGLAVVEAIRADAALSTLPVLVFAETASAADARASYERAANAFIPKPSTEAEFRAVARTISSFWLDTATLPPTA